MLHDPPAKGPGAGPAAAPAFDPSLYPRTYRIPAGRRAFLRIVGGLMVLGGLAFVGPAVFGPVAHGFWNSVGVICLWLAIALVGAVCFAMVGTMRVTLHSDAAEVVNPWSSRRLRREEIRGFRLLRGGAKYPTLILFPHDAHRKRLAISNSVDRDAAFNAWFVGLPNLAVEERRQTESAVAADPRFGSNPAERLRWLAAARKFARGSQLATLVICAWGWLDPQPYRLVIAVLVAVPWVVLLAVRASRGLCGIGGAGGRASLFGAFAFPGVLLSLRAFIDFQIMDWHQAVALGIAGGIGLTVLAMVVDVELRRGWRSGLFIAVVMSAYGYGTVVEANALLDHSQSSPVHVVVVAKHLTHAQITLRYLQLEPWGPYEEPNDVSVTRSVYDAARPGDEVCIDVRPGALAISWYVVQSCP